MGHTRHSVNVPWTLQDCAQVLEVIKCTEFLQQNTHSCILQASAAFTKYRLSESYVRKAASPLSNSFNLPRNHISSLWGWVKGTRKETGRRTLGNQGSLRLQRCTQRHQRHPQAFLCKQRVRAVCNEPLLTWVTVPAETTPA